MPHPFIAVDDLSKHFTSGDQPVEVFTGLTFRVEPGESLAVVGRSGSGKSTLLNLLSGLESADAGAITLFGERVEQRSKRDWAELRRQSIGVVFQEVNLMPALTLADNVRLRAHLAGQPGGEELEWLERLGVGAQASRFPDQVSGGQRQRAALAMVFAMKPQVILADEPTGSLDRHTADEVAECLFSVQQTSGCTLVLATHDTTLASRCERLLDLSKRG